MILPYMMIFCAFSSLNTCYEVSGTDSVQAYLLVSQFTAFLHIEGLWWPSVKQLLSVLSFNSICSPYVSVLHFGNSHHYSKIFHFDYICYDDLWSVISDVTIAKKLWLTESSGRQLSYFGTEYFKIKLCRLFFGYNEIAHFIDYSIV